MEISRAELSKNYSNLPDDELLRLYSAGTLTEIAYEVLELELNNRGLRFLSKPKELQVETISSKNPLSKYWNGEARLVNVFWLFGVIGLVILSFLLTYSSTKGNLALFGIVIIFKLIYDVFTFVSIWRCAWNVKWKGWGYLARAYVVIYVTLLIAPFLLWGISEYIL